MSRSPSCGGCQVQGGIVAIAAIATVASICSLARADVFGEYAPTGSIDLPQPYCVFDVLPDGRVIAVHLADVYVEDGVGTGTFSFYGTLTGADMPDSWVPAFVRVSPDGSKIAVGNNGGSTFSNFEVGVFDFPSLAGDWYGAGHYDAEWYDNTHLAITTGEFLSPSIVTVLDTTSSTASPVNRTVIANIGGSPAGISFDSAGNLYTGNGYDSDGPSDTGWIKVFDHAAWSAALSGGPALDFESTGTLVVDLLSAGSLGFDAEGNLHVGGGDSSGPPGEYDTFALVRASAVAAAMAGFGPVDPDDPAQVRRFDPDQTANDNFYTVTFNETTGQLYANDFVASGAVYTYGTSEPIPAISQWGVTAMTLVILTAGTLTIGRERRSGVAS